MTISQGFQLVGIKRVAEIDENLNISLIFLAPNSQTVREQRQDRSMLLTSKSPMPLALCVLSSRFFHWTTWRQAGMLDGQAIPMVALGINSRRLISEVIRRS